MTASVPARLVAEPQAVSFVPALAGLPGLDPVDWTGAGLVAPEVIDTPALLSEVTAQVVLLTWADAEWAATDHVFCSSSQAMPRSRSDSGSFPGWVKDDADMTSPTDGWIYWGYFRLVRVGQTTVLLYKSNTHYARQGAAALTALVTRLATLTPKPEVVISTGTAGGANSTDHVGTVVITRSATLYEQGMPAADWPTYTSSWRPATAHMGSIEPLLMPIPITGSALSDLAQQFDVHEHTEYTLQQLDPLQLNHPDATPQVRDRTGEPTPLLTAASFLVGTTDDRFAAYGCIEMDDAIVAAACGAAGVEYGSVRNLSDPAQNPMLDTAGGTWGSAVYRQYGFYTSFNGALAAWAAIG